MQHLIVEEMKFIIKSNIPQPNLQHILIGFVESRIPEPLLWSQIVINVHSMLGGQSQEIPKIAAIIELLMMSLDLMDDFQDGDLAFQSEENIETKDSYTIIMSLLLASLSTWSEICHQAHYDSRYVSQRILASIQGQHLDLNPDLNSEEEYYEIIKQKSGSLIQIAIEMGMFGTDCSNEQKQKLREIAIYSGMYQQLGNDIRDVFRWDDKNDLISRKKTFPIYFLLEQSEFNASLRLLHDYYQGHIDFSELIPNKHNLYQAMKQSKVEEAAMIMQKKWMNQALNIFDDLKTTNISNMALKRLLFPE